MWFYLLTTDDSLMGKVWGKTFFRWKTPWTALTEIATWVWHQANQKNVSWKIKKGFLKLGISMFVIQLSFHPWQGGQQMPAKWLWPICVSGEFDKIVWSIIRGIQTKKPMNSLDNGAILVLITLHCELVIFGSWGHMLSFESLGSWIDHNTINHLKLQPFKIFYVSTRFYQPM